MKNHKKLSLKKLSIAKLEVYVMHQTLKGGGDNSHIDNCQTSTKTKTELSIQIPCDGVSRLAGPCM